MSLIFITCVLHCCTRVMLAAPEWDKKDNIQLQGAQARCHELYKQSPCLTTFTKMEDNVFRAICGKDNN